LALVVRAAYLVESAANPFRSFIGLDMTGYHRWAVSVLRGHGLGEMPFTQAPFYPLVLAVTYLFTGQEWFRGVWGNLLPSALAVFFVADAARRWRGPAAACGAGILFALYKPAIFYTGVLLPPSWVFLLSAMSLWYSVRVVLAEGRQETRLSAGAAFSEGCQGTRLLAGAGLSAGLLSLAQPVAVCGLLPLVVYLWRTGRKGGGTKPWRRALTYLLFAAVLPFGTLLYNGIGGKAWSVVAVNAGINLYIGNGPQANGGYVRPPAMREDRDLLGIGAARTLADSPGLGYAGANRFWTDRAFSFAFSHPARTASLFLRKLHLFFGQYEVPQVESLPFERRYARLLRWPLPGMACLSALGLFGLLARRRDALARGLGWSVLATAAGVCAFFVTARFRVPVVPVLALLAGLGIAEFAAVAARRGAAGIVAGTFVGTAVVTGAAEAPGQPRGTMVPSGRALALPAIVSALFAALLMLNLAGIQRSASDGQSYFRLGIILERQQNPAEAMQAYRQALDIDPAQGQAEVNLGALLARAGRQEEARVHLARGVALNPLSVIGLTSLGQLEQLRGRRDEALALYRRALRVDPGQAEARRCAAQLLQELGRPEEARRLAQDGEASTPTPTPTPTPPSTPALAPPPDPSARP
jgi:tetratricopeptide (TPR) repeat protein